MALNLPPGTDLTRVPLAVNPSGAPPNFVNPPSLIGTVQGVGIALAIVSFGMVCLRWRINLKHDHKITLDDLFVAIGFVLALGYTGMVCSMGTSSRHAWDTPLSILNPEYMQKLFATSLFYGPMLFFAKSAILLLYLRAFRPKRWLRIGVYITLGVLLPVYWMNVGMGIAWCMPHHGDPWALPVLVNCNHLATPGFVQAGVNIAADLAIFFLPLPIILKLQMPRSKKIALCGVFATGILALVASALTVYYRVQIIHNPDSTWSTAQTYVCIQAEVYATIMVACMPSFARAWNVSFKETKFYASLQYLFTSIKSTPNSLKDSRKQASGESSNLQNDSRYVELHNGTHDNEVRTEGSSRSKNNAGIYRMVTVNVSSETAPDQRVPHH
ncbi:hypothetical protein EAF04_001500 [Stromatinia cepivora]|nr:hypothetical protein EAF04_001500 [Stromatinia cepivora]